MSQAYFAREALSNSGIKQLLKSPAHFITWQDAPPEKSSALRMGQALHQMILEPLKNTRRLFNETKTFNSKAGEAFLAHYPDDICLTAEEHQTVQWMAGSVIGYAKIRQLIAMCRTEVQIYGQEPSAFGPVPSKAMVDGIAPGFILDLKTTSEDACDFPWTARRYKYDIQAAWYEHMAYTHLDGKRREVYFVVVEKSPPFGVLLFQCKPETMAAGRKKCAEAIEIYGQCKSLKRWPAYDTNEIRQF